MALKDIANGIKSIGSNAAAVSKRTQAASTAARQTTTPDATAAETTGTQGALSHGVTGTAVKTSTQNIQNQKDNDLTKLAKTLSNAKDVIQRRLEVQKLNSTNGFGEVSPAYKNADGSYTLSGALNALGSYYKNGRRIMAGAMQNSIMSGMTDSSSSYYSPYYATEGGSDGDADMTSGMMTDLSNMQSWVQSCVDKGYPDSYIVSNLDLSDYSYLTKAGKKTYTLTQSVGYLGDATVYGMIYKARNPDAGDDILENTTSYFYGVGNQYVPDKSKEAALDATSEYYQPYASGATYDYDSLTAKYGTKYGDFTSEDWLSSAGATKMANSGDKNARADYAELEEAFETTAKAREEYTSLQEKCKELIANGATADQVYTMLQGETEDSLKTAYPTLYKMETARSGGGFLNTTGEVDFAMPYFKYELQQMEAENDYKTASEAVEAKYAGKQALHDIAVNYGVRDGYVDSVAKAFETIAGRELTTDELTQQFTQMFGPDSNDSMTSDEKVYSLLSKAGLAEDWNSKKEAVNADSTEANSDEFVMSSVNEQNSRLMNTLRNSFLAYLNGEAVTSQTGANMIAAYPELSVTGTSHSNVFTTDRGHNVTANNKDYIQGDRMGDNAHAVFNRAKEMWSNGVISGDNLYGMASTMMRLIDSAEAYGMTVDEYVASGKDPDATAYFESIGDKLDTLQTEYDEKQTAATKEAASAYGDLLRSGVINGEKLDEAQQIQLSAIYSTDISKVQDEGYQDARVGLLDYGKTAMQSTSIQDSKNSSVWSKLNVHVNPQDPASELVADQVNTAVAVQGTMYIDWIEKVAVSLGVDFNTACEYMGFDVDTITQEAYDSALENYVALSNEYTSQYSDMYAARRYGTKYASNVGAESVLSGEREGTSIDTAAYGKGTSFGNWLSLTGKTGLYQHLSSLADTAYFFTRHTDEELESMYHALYTPQEFTQELISTIDTIGSESLRSSLMQQLSDYDGDIYKFKFDVMNVGIHDLAAQADDTLTLCYEEAQDVMTEGQYQWFMGGASSINSMLSMLEAATIGKVAGLTGLSVTASSFLGTTLTFGATEGFGEVGNQVLDNGGSMAEAWTKGGLTAGIVGSLEAFMDPINDKILGTAGKVADKSFTESALYNSVGKFLYSKTGSAALSNAVAAGVTVAKNLAFNTGKEVLQEVGQEELENLCTALITNNGNESRAYRDFANEFSDTAVQTAISTLLMSGATGGVTKTVNNIVDAKRGYSFAVNAGKIDIQSEGVTAEGTHALENMTDDSLAEREKDRLDTAEAAMQEQEKAAESENETDASTYNACKKAVEKARANYEATQKYADFVNGLKAQCDRYQRSSADVINGLRNISNTTGKAIQEIKAKLKTVSDQVTELTKKRAEAVKLYDTMCDEFNRAQVPTPEQSTQIGMASTNIANLNGRIAELTQQKVELTQQGNELNEQRKAEVAAVLKEAELKADAAIAAEQMQNAEDVRQAEVDALKAMNDRIVGDIFKTEEDVTKSGFLADVSKAVYEKGKKALSNYSGMLASVQQEVADMVRNSFSGFNVEFKDLGSIGGFISVDNKNITLNSRASIGALINSIVAHEIMHIAERSNGYSALVDKVTKLVYGQEYSKGVTEQMQSDLDNIKQTYEEAGEHLTPVQAVKELVAELFARNVLSGNTANGLADNSTIKINWAEFLSNGNKAYAANVTEWLTRRSLDMEKLAKKWNKLDRVFGIFKKKDAAYQGLADIASGYASIINSFSETLADAGKNIESGEKAQDISEPKANADTSAGQTAQQEGQSSAASSEQNTEADVNTDQNAQNGSEIVSEPADGQVEAEENDAVKTAPEASESISENTAEAEDETEEEAPYVEYSDPESVSKGDAMVLADTFVEAVMNGETIPFGYELPSLTRNSDGVVQFSTEEDGDIFDRSPVAQAVVRKLLASEDANAELNGTEDDIIDRYELFRREAAGEGTAFQSAESVADAVREAEQGNRIDEVTDKEFGHVNADLAEEMRENGYTLPTKGNEQFGVRTIYETIKSIDRLMGDYLDNAQMVKRAAESADTLRYIRECVLNNALLRGFMKHGTGVDNDNGDNKLAPVRKNTGGYVLTFDLDANCPRTYEYGAVRDKIQKALGRKLTSDEAYTLIANMRAYGLMIPCTYCYVESKRIAMDEAYNFFLTNRSNIINGTTMEEKLKDLPSSVYDKSKKQFKIDKKTGENKWQNRMNALLAQGSSVYNPTAEELASGLNRSIAAVYNYLDSLYDKSENYVADESTVGEQGGKKLDAYKDFKLPVEFSKLYNDLLSHFGVNKDAQKDVASSLEEFALEWLYNKQTSNVENIAPEYQGADTIDINAIALDREAMNYSKSSSSAKQRSKYAPYSDQEQHISIEDKIQMNAHGGFRIHSSNDFLLDNLVDYIQFVANISADKRGGFGWKSHAYTKDLVFAKLMSKTGIRLNISVAYYGSGENIRPNLEEGANLEEAKKLAQESKDIGIMAMVTNDDQLSMALNDPSVNMIIPFHASSMPKKLWYNLMQWFDYSKYQNDSKLNITEMKQALKKAGVSTKGITGQAVKDLYNKTFGVVQIYYANDGKKWVKKDTPQGVHLLPSDQLLVSESEVEGMSREEQIEKGLLIPGFNNDVNTYFELCQKYGVRPRFKGVTVKEADGTLVDITQHSQYLKVLKEGARDGEVGNEQREIEFNFGENNELINEAIEQAARAARETNKYNELDENGNRKYKASDEMFDLVNDFTSNVIGKDRPVGWISINAAITNFYSNDQAIDYIQEMQGKGVEGFTNEEFKELQRKYPVKKLTKSSASLRVNGVETEHSLFDPSRTAYEAALDRLSDMLKVSEAAGDEREYRTLVGHIYGLLGSKRYAKTSPINSPLNTLRQLATDIGTSLYEGQNTEVRQPDGSIMRVAAEYSDWSNQIITDRVTARTFAPIMADIATTINKQLSFDTGNSAVSFEDFFFAYMTQSDAAMSGTIRNIAKSFEQKLDENPALKTAITNRRNQLLHYVYGNAAQKVYSMMRSHSDAKPKQRGILRAFEEAFIDKTAAADLVDRVMNTGRSAAEYDGAFAREANKVNQMMKRVTTWLNGNCVDLDGYETGAESFADIARRTGVNYKDIQTVNSYMMAKEAIDRYNNGRAPFETDFDVSDFPVNPTQNDLEQFVADIERNEPKVARFAQGVYSTWDTFMRRIMVANGLITQEEYDRMSRGHPHYAPLKRYDTTYGFTLAQGNSSEKVLNPLETMGKMMEQFVGEAADNRVGQKFDEIYRSTPGMGWLAAQVEGDEPAGANVITVHHNDGNMTYYIMKDEGLANLIRGSAYRDTALKTVLKPIRNITRTMSMLTTGVNALFAGKNAFRDFQHSVNHGSWAYTYLDGAFKWMKSVADVTAYALSKGKKGSQQMKDFANMGGYGYERVSIDRSVGTADFNRTIFGENKAKAVARKGLEIVEAKTLNEIIETASRFAEYKYGREDTTTGPNWNAYMNAREATVDFDRGGSSAALDIVKAFVPFANATIQGLDNAWRTVADKNERKRLPERLAKGFINNALTGAMSAMMMMCCGDDDDKEKYLDLEDSVKQTYILIPGRLLDGSRDCWRIPVSQDVFDKVFYEVGRKAAEEFLTGNTDDSLHTGFLADMIGVAWSATVGSVTDVTTIVSPVYQVLQNKSWYGGQIISTSLQNQSYTNQYDASTPTVYIKAAQLASSILDMVGASDDSDLRQLLSSPVALEYWTKQYSGIIGQLVPSMLSPDKYTGEVTPLKSAGEVVRNAYTIDMDTSSEISDAYYAARSDITAINYAVSAGKGYGTLNPLLNDEQTQAAMDEAYAFTHSGGAFKTADTQISDLWELYAEIQSDTKLSDTEKDNRCETEVYAPMREIMKEALEAYSEYQSKYENGSTWGKVATIFDTVEPMTGTEEETETE